MRACVLSLSLSVLQCPALVKQAWHYLLFDSICLAGKSLSWALVKYPSVFYPFAKYWKSFHNLLTHSKINFPAVLLSVWADDLGVVRTGGWAADFKPFPESSHTRLANIRCTFKHLWSLKWQTGISMHKPQHKILTQLNILTWSIKILRVKCKDCLEREG